MLHLIDALKPDMILYNGHIITVDGLSVVQAVAVKGDWIVAVGEDAVLKRLRGSRTRMVDLKGKTVVPGFNDGHLHMMDTGLELTEIDLRYPSVRSVKDLIEAVAKKVNITPPGEWIKGSRWDQSKLEERRFPTRWDLDVVSPRHPVYLKRVCSHIVVVNSKALELAGITRDTPQPEGGEIVRDGKGEPTGLLLERPAFGLVEALIPKADLVSKKEAIREACRRFNAAGITSVNDGGFLVEDYQAYHEVLKEGNLTVRVYGMVRLELREMPDEEAVAYLNHIGPRHGFGDHCLRMGAIKISIDGGVGGRTSLMRKPYRAGPPNNYGIQSVPQDRLRKMIKLIHHMGWQIAVHAAGGKAMDHVLAIFREANREAPIREKRWYLVHAYDPSSQNLKEMKRMGVGVAANPSFIHFLGDSFISNMGRKWSYRASPHKSYLRHGIPISGGSDASVTPYDPLWGIYSAVTRKTQFSQEVCGPDQCISTQDALRMFTQGGTWMSFEEEIKGSIASGKLADMVVLGENIFKVDPDWIPRIPVLATLWGGKAVYVAPRVGLEFGPYDRTH
jgi:predicted amidohydrolase YtcJ